MGTLEQIKRTLADIKTVDGTILSAGNIEAAINALEAELDCLESVQVQGRDNLDRLLGVMLAIEMIIGKDKKE